MARLFFFIALPVFLFLSYTGLTNPFQLSSDSSFLLRSDPCPFILNQLFVARHFLYRFSFTSSAQFYRLYCTVQTRPLLHSSDSVFTAVLTRPLLHSSVSTFTAVLTIPLLHSSVSTFTAVLTRPLLHSSVSTFTAQF